MDEDLEIAEHDLLCPSGHQYKALGTVDEGGFSAAEGEDARCPVCAAEPEGLA